MKYEQHTQGEIDLAIAQAMHGREVEYSQHELNLSVYRAMLDAMNADPNYVDTPMAPPETTWRAYIERMAREAAVEMAKIDTIHAALSIQLPSGPKRDAAMTKAAEIRATPKV